MDQMGHAKEPRMPASHLISGRRKPSRLAGAAQRLFASLGLLLVPITAALADPSHAGEFP
jgi:hypothetical protein